jgi:ribosomal protein L40E
MKRQSEISSLRSQIHNSMQEKETDQLMTIWLERDEDAWSAEALEVVQEILVERLGRLPDMSEIVETDSVEKAAQSLMHQDIPSADATKYANTYLKARADSRRREQQRDQSGKQSQKQATRLNRFLNVALLLLLVPFCSYFLTGGEYMWYFTGAGAIVVLILALVVSRGKPEESDKAAPAISANPAQIPSVIHDSGDTTIAHPEAGHYRTCQTCHHGNPPDATMCEQCGARFQDV